MNFTPAALLLSATIADISITLFGIGVGCFETNPIVAAIGWGAMLFGKMSATLFVVFALRALRDRLGVLAFVPGLVVLAFVYWNIINVAAQLI
jgi:hypothetical protein